MYRYDPFTDWASVKKQIPICQYYQFQIIRVSGGRLAGRMF